MTGLENKRTTTLTMIYPFRPLGTLWAAERTQLNNIVALCSLPQKSSPHRAQVQGLQIKQSKACCVQMPRCYWQSALGKLPWPGIFVGHCTVCPVKSFVSQELLDPPAPTCWLSPCRAQQHACALPPGDSAAPFVPLLCAGPPLMHPLSHEETTVLHAEGVKVLLIHAAAPHGDLAQGNQ